MVAQFAANTTNSEEAIYFLSLISCSINKLKSHILFTCRNFVFQFFLEKNFAPENGEGAATPCPPFLYDPDKTKKYEFEQ